MNNQITVAICDDETKILPYLARKITEMFQKYHVVAVTTEYDSSQDLEKTLEKKEKYDLYFLDIDMPKMDGLEFARCLSEIQPDAVLIFVSAKEEYVFESFLYHPFSFIRKKRFEEDLERTVQDLCKHFQLVEEQKCQLMDEMGHPFWLSLKDTLYLEAKDKYVNIVTEKETFYVRSTLSELEKTLENKRFIRIHKSFLVNLRMIYKIQYSKIILDNGQELPLSRNKVAEVKRRFCQEE
jgi:DNA-binding LytR/AlgR family response regulator